jgi:hypothetical protein
MNAEPPALLRRLRERLERAPGPVHLAILVRDLLRPAAGTSLRPGMHILEPLLRSDPRFVETRQGWMVGRAGPSGEDPGLGGPFAALGVLPPPPEQRLGPWALLCCAGDGTEELLLEGGPGTRGPDFPPEDVPGDRPLVSGRGPSDRTALRGWRPETTHLHLGRLARTLAGITARYGLGDLAARLGLYHLQEEGPRGEARLAATVWLDLRERLREEGLLDPLGLDGLLHPGPPPAGLDGHLDPADLDALPDGPGVYRFLDGDGHLLYVGKSVHVRARATSYFTGEPRDDKDRRLRTSAREVRAEALGSEPEALLREQELIRRHRPPLNAQQAVAERTGPRGDRLLVLPGPTPRRRTLMLLRGGRLAARLTVGLRREGRARAREALRRVFFPGEVDVSPEDPRRKIEAEEGGHLLASWLRRHPHRVLWFDPTEARGPEEAERHLERYLDADPREGAFFLRRPA